MKNKTLAHNFGLILKKKRTLQGVSQEALANRTELDRTYISQLERGRKIPTIQTLFSLCHSLDIPPREMMDELSISLGPKKEAPEQNSTQTPLQIYGTGISCGRPLTPDYVAEEALVIDDLLVKNKEKTFFVKANGDSMGPTIQEGDYLVVDASKAPKNGEVVLVQINGEFSIKRYYKQRNQVFLKSDNVHYDDLHFQEGETLLCIGVVTASVRLNP